MVGARQVRAAGESDEKMLRAADIPGDDDVDDDTAAPGLLDRLVESMKTWTQVEENPDVDDPDPII